MMMMIIIILIIKDTSLIGFYLHVNFTFFSVSAHIP